MENCSGCKLLLWLSSKDNITQNQNLQKGSNYVLEWLFTRNTITIPLHTNLQIWQNGPLQSFRAAHQPNAERLSLNYRASDAKYFDFLSAELRSPQYYSVGAHAATTQYSMLWWFTSTVHFSTFVAGHLWEHLSSELWLSDYLKPILHCTQNVVVNVVPCYVQYDLHPTGVTMTAYSLKSIIINQTLIWSHTAISGTNRAQVLTSKTTQCTSALLIRLLNLPFCLCSPLFLVLYGRPDSRFDPVACFAQQLTLYRCMSPALLLRERFVF